MRDFKPINAHGKKMPAARVREQLFQIFVEDTETGQDIAVAPRMSRTALEPLVEKINRAIIAGKETAWSNPRLVPVKPL